MQPTRACVCIYRFVQIWLLERLLCAISSSCMYTAACQGHRLSIDRASGRALDRSLASKAGCARYYYLLAGQRCRVRCCRQRTAGRARSVRWGRPRSGCGCCQAVGAPRRPRQRGRQAPSGPLPLHPRWLPKHACNYKNSIEGGAQDVRLCLGSVDTRFRPKSGSCYSSESAQLRCLVEAGNTHGAISAFANVRMHRQDRENVDSTTHPRFSTRCPHPYAV